MKKFSLNISILCFAFLLIACGDSGNNDQVVKTDSTTTETSAKPAASPAAVSPGSTEVAAAESAAMVKGKEVYMRNCVACHQPNGKGIPPAFPSIAGSPVVLGDEEAQISLILNGKTGTAMVAFGPQLSDEEIAAVITYQRNSFGNNVGGEVTADQVKAQR